jgi:hypothetical protein
MAACARSREVLVLLAGALAACSLAYPLDAFHEHSGTTVSTEGSAPEPEPEGGSVEAGAPPVFTLRCNDLSPLSKFCDDFERTGVAGDWPSLITNRGGSATLDTNDSRSPLRSLLCTTPGGAGSQQAWLQRSFPEAAGTIMLRFDLKIGARIRSGDMVAGTLIALGTSDTNTFNQEISIKESGTSWLEADYRVNPARFHDHAFTHDLAYGSWQRVTIALHLEGRPPRAIVSLDDDVVVDDPLRFPVSRSPFLLQIGTIYATDSSEPTTLHVDNVALDWQ